jgi:spore germination cell wall hydrolase CwlJ-like protein
MFETAIFSRALLRQGRAQAAAKVGDHGPKLLLALGGAAIALSALSMAHALAKPVSPVTHDPQALRAMGYFTPLSSGGRRFTDAADEAVLTLVKAYGAAATPRTGLFGLTQLAQSSSEIAPQAYRQLTPQQAQAINAAIPFSAEANPAARAFRIEAAEVADHASALNCLTSAIYYEAASESDDGEAAVAQVVLNRLRHPLFPKTVCGVVFQGSELPTGCQFTFTCDGSLGRRPSIEGWTRAQRIAQRALGGYVMKQVGEATHYHTQWVVPYWQPTVTKLTQIGAHIFYRWSGGMGSPEAFHGRYAGLESPPAVVAGLDPRIVAATPAPEIMTVASTTQASQPAVAVVRIHQQITLPDAAPSATAAADSEVLATANTPRPAPEVKPAQPAPRTSFFGHGAAAAPTRIGW